MNKTIMKTIRLSIALLFAMGLSHTVYAGQIQEQETGETQETQPEPECDNGLSPWTMVP